MGNVFTAARSLNGTAKCASARTWQSEPELVQEDLLLSELLELQQVELWRIHWCLSQNLLQDFPPIPPHWLQAADARSTASTMLKCYHEEGAWTALDVALRMMGRDAQACHLHHISSNPPTAVLAPKPAQDLVKARRRKLIGRMQRPDAVLDALQDYGILSASNRAAVQIYAGRKEKNRALVDLVLRQGGESEEVFCEALSQSEPFLLQELELGPVVDKDPSETSVLRDMLECLASEELRSFQWLVSDHMTGENPTLIDKEQLQRADRPETQRLLETYFGVKQAESIAVNILLKIVPTLSICLRGEVVTSQRSSDTRGEKTTDTKVVEMTPEVSEDGTLFRLRCRQPGFFRCGLTDLLLEGSGDVAYQTVPWDVDFLSSKGLRPAGPLFRFTLLTGSFHRLHLPHCQLLSDGGQHFLSVAHVTDGNLDFIAPDQVTDGHVIINISGFSCFGLVTAAAAAAHAAISGLVLLFSEPSTYSLFVLLLPTNVCLTQVIKEWKRRIRAEYVETISDCELIPNQTYELSGQPVAFIQPESSKFMNFSDYNNFLASFQVQLAADVRTVELRLRTRVTAVRLIGWLFGFTESAVWQRVVQLRAAASTVCTEGNSNTNTNAPERSAAGCINSRKRDG